MMIIPEENGGGQGALAKHAKKIFLSSKPAPAQPQATWIDMYLALFQTKSIWNDLAI